MGLDVSCNTRLGFPVQKADFVTEMKADFRVCDNGHRAPDGRAKFCSECGAPFRDASLREPTARLVRYANKVGREPVDLWDEWWPEDYWCPPEPDNGELGFHDVRALQCSEDDGSEEPILIFGVSLKATKSHRRADRGDVAGISLDELNSALHSVQAMAKLMGLEDRPIGLYTCAYASY